MVDETTTTPEAIATPEGATDYWNPFLEWIATQPVNLPAVLVERFSSEFSLTREDKDLLMMKVQSYAGKPLPKAPAKTSGTQAKTPVKPKPEDLLKPQAPTPASSPKTPTVKKEQIIPRTPFPKWWKDLSVEKIDISTSGAQTIVPWKAGHISYLVSLVIVVDGETDISLRLSGTAITGPMSFGGSDEPRGITINFGEGPIPCGNQIMSLYSDPPTPPVQVSGLAIYYTEPSEKPLT